MAPRKSDNIFKKGEKVKARWSGSNTFYDARIIDVFVRTCKVEFSDGTVSSVKLGDIKSPKSEKIEKDTSPKRTRSRSRSTGRQRSRSRSPARTEKKKTATKNEKKTPKNKVEDKSKSEESPKTTNSIKKDETDSVTVKSSLTREKIGTMKEETKAGVSSVTTTNSILSKNLYISLEKGDPAEVRLRSSRQSSLRSADVSSSETKKSYEKSNASGKKESAKYSDDEESDDDEIKVIPKQPSKVLKVLTFFATLLKIILMPMCLLFLIFACTKRQCTILDAPQFYTRFRDLVNALKTPFPCVILFHLSVCLLSLIPLGKKVTGFPYGPKKSTKEYCINGFITLIVGIIVFGICSYFGVYMNWGYDKIRPLAISIALYCALYSLVLHVVSLIHGEWEKESPVPVLGSFFNGVYFNPYLFGKVDIKTTFIRAGFLGSLLINLSILLKYYFMRDYITIPLAVSAGMSAFFILDYFVREEKMLSTATYTSDSVGYGFIMTTGFLIPIGLNLPLVYLFIFEQNAHLIPHYCSAGMVALFFVGYYIYMSSGNLKHNFRNNPFSPSLSDVDSIPTSQKKRLISSKLWGLVRHPNYLGLIIMATAWTLPCGFTHFTPYGPLVILIIALIMRCIRVEGECKEKYGPAWNNYTEKVRSRLIPYIF